MAAKEMGEKQLFSITVVVLGVLLLVIGTLIFVSYRQYSKIRRDIRVLDEAIKGYEKVWKEHDEKQKRLDESAARFEACKKYLPTEEDINRLLDDLSLKRKESGLEHNSFRKETARMLAVRPGMVKPDYETISYVGEFKGDYHQLIRFVSEVENWKNFSRFVSITAFNVEAANKGVGFDDRAQKHTIKMTMELYKYQEPAVKAVVVPGVVPGAAGAAPRS